MLFNIFINDLFAFVLDTDVCNIADDNTLYACDISLEAVINRLNLDIERINKWFVNNSLVSNHGKFQFMFLRTNENKFIFIGNMEIKPQDQVEFLGLKIDKKLKFRNDINYICNKANCKISELEFTSDNNGDKYIHTPLLFLLYIDMDVLSKNRNESRVVATGGAEGAGAPPPPPQ